jgi:transposase
VKLGRPRGSYKSKLDEYLPEIEALLKTGSSQVFISKRYGVARSSLYKWLKKHKIDVTPQP